MFNKQKEKIDLLKSNHVKEAEKESHVSKATSTTIIFNDQMMEKNMNWEYATFSTTQKKEDIPNVISDWTESSVTTSVKGIETRNLIFKSKDVVDYYMCKNN